MHNIKLFALDASREFGEKVSNYLTLPLSKHKEFYFQDGECYVASEENVRNCDVYVIQSLYGDEQETVNDKLMKLLIFLGSLHDASAYRVTAVIPYLGGRQDRKTSSRAPITTKYLAHFFQSVFTRRVLTIDVHNPGSFQNSFARSHFDNLEGCGFFAKFPVFRYFGKNLVVMSPDEGGLKRARKFASFLEQILNIRIGTCCMDKDHNDFDITGNGLLENGELGKVSGKNVIIIDDMVSSGKTMYECIKVLQDRGALSIKAICATHGLFVGDANKYLDSDFIHHIVVSDTIPPFRVTNPKIYEKITIMQTHELFAEAIRRTHKGESLSDLIKNNDTPLIFKNLKAEDLQMIT